MKNQKFSQDQLVDFFFEQGKKIKNYKFDLFYDIAKIVNYSKDVNNYRDEYGQIITNKPVEKKYIFLIRETGTYLIEKEDTETIKSVERAFSEDAHQKYEIVIIPNSSYLFDRSFCEISKL
mgnify:FL=1|tara:strand:+ start:3003 stop:3365 length:363 start_codon:yes stop_codon:yes gene_type:complete